MSKKMWSKIFKSSKTTKAAKLSTATAAAAAKANKRCSIYEEYQQLNGAKVEGAKKQKKLARGVAQQSKQPQEQEQQKQLNQQQQQPNELQQQEPTTAGGVASATDASTHKNAETTPTNMNKNSEVTQMLGTSDVTLASSSTSNNSKPPAGANDQLIAYKNNNNSNNGAAKQQSTFAKVVSSFSLKRNNNAGALKQQQPQQQPAKGSGSGKAAGKLPKSEFIQHATPTNQQQTSGHALQQQLKQEKGGDLVEVGVTTAAVNGQLQQQQEKQQQEAKRSSQILIVIKQIVTSTPQMVWTATAAPTATMQLAAVAATDTATASVVLAKDRATDCAVNQMYSSATHDNVAISAASAAATKTTTTTTTTPSKNSAPTTTFKTNNKNSTSTATNTRISAAATQVEKNNSNTIASTADPYPDAPTQLVPCPICQRTFNPVTLQKHVGICEKMATKKRNVFDSSRQRREGTELASYPLPKNFGLPAAKQEARGQSPKPLQHIGSPILTRKKSSGGEELARSTARASMRKLAVNAQSQSPNTAATANSVAVTASQVVNNSQMTTSTASLPGAGSFTRDRMRSSDRSLAKRIQPPPAEQCPHCERCFGPKAYDRHVEWCKEKALQASIKHTAKTEQNLAKERLEARTKYRAPCLKTKRSLNRDKYAGLAGDENEFGETVKTANGSHNSNSNNNSSNNNNSSLTNGVGRHGNSNNINSSGNGNGNGVMSLSMTSSLTSERKPSIMKDFHGTLHTRKVHRNAIELPPPSPRRLANVATDDYVKSACFDNFRLMGARLAANDASKKMSKRRVTLNTINTQARPQSPQFEKIRTRKYDESLPAVTTEQTRDHCLGDANALSATLTYTACPLNGVNKSKTSTRVQTQPTASVAQVCKRRTKLKPKVPSEPSIRVDAGTVMTDHDDEPLQESKVRNSQSYELVQKQAQQQEQQHLKLQRYSPPLTTPMKMLQTHHTTLNKLPNTTIAVTTVERATTSTAADSHTKLEVNAIRSLTICRPKRKKLVRQSISAHAAPMKAIPLLKESIEMFGAPTKILNNGGEELKDSDSRTLADDETDDEIKVIKAPPKLVRDKSFVLSGLPSDRYDPFLSAKRQLEELCSSSPPNNPSFSSNLPKTTPQTPVSPAGLPAKMSTSLTLSTSTPNSSPLTNNSQNQRQTATPSVNATKPTSNFRRTSSLRGPRRSPMLSSRPLFAQNHRPTIQRGLSDEGPISTNFLKPEEYDEMPVRSVCVNDYALTKSPRVARRDNSLSNRKQGLKLNVQGAAATMTSATNTPNCATMLGVNSTDELMNSAAKYLSKTDSLAAFLKYEKELDKLNAQATVDKPTEQNTTESSATNLHNNISSKEFKDKSNTLSKQNSAKSIKAEVIESPISNTNPVVEAHSFQHLPTPVEKTPNAANTSPYERANTNIQKTQSIRLESIALPQATSTPITKPGTTRAPTTPTQLPIVNRPVNLNTLLAEPRPATTSLLSAYSKEGKSTSSSEYIDPKLINRYDNLPVNLNTVHTLKSVGGNNVERRLDFSSSSSECSATQTGPISQLTKLLPLTKPTEVLHTTAPAVTTTSPAVDIPSRPSTTDDTQPNAHPTLSQRSSTEGRNLLNRKKRLGRNHFLYDVSPEADDSCSADDEANRSSVEYYESKYKSTYQQQQQEQQEQQPQTCFVNTRGQTTQLKTPPIVPPLPIFDDFDFEEFLSSFENDDEQFPLFKDCREFLLNRSSNKQRSTQTPSSINANNNSNHNNNNSNNNSKKNQYTTPTKDYYNTTNHFQFPSLASNKYPHPTHLLTPSSRRSHDESRPKSKESSPLSDRYEELKHVNTQSHTYVNDGMTTKRHADVDHKKREIFISIETEPNEHGRSPISPDSLRSMVGNPQTMVEVEVDGCDNKFSKISDDEEQLPPRHAAGHAGDMLMRCTPFNTGNHLPNVQLNNAKNLIQRMQDDFRQMSEEVGANIRQAMTGLNAVGSNTTMLYGNEQVGMTGVGERGGVAGGKYMSHNPNTTPPPSTASAGAVTPMYAASGDVSGDACGDSDDMSSLDGYPISSKSSRRGVGSKLSADSAYGSLSRQRSSELSTTPQRSATRTRPTTSNPTGMTTATLPAMLPADVQTQKQIQQQQQYQYQQQQQQLQLQQQQQMPQKATQLYKYAPVAARPRRISASSSSDNSDGSDCNVKYKQQQQKQQQQQQQQLYSGVGNKNHNNNNNNNYISTHYTPQHSSIGASGNNNHNNTTNNNFESPLSSPTTMEHARLAASNATNTGLPQDEAQTAPAAANKGHYSSSSSLSSANAAMSASMKMSKFCHECGAKFLVEQAKFCMDCGIKRIVL